MGLDTIAAHPQYECQVAHGVGVAGLGGLAEPLRPRCAPSRTIASVSPESAALRSHCSVSASSPRTARSAPSRATSNLFQANGFVRREAQCPPMFGNRRSAYRFGFRRQ